MSAGEAVVFDAVNYTVFIIMLCVSLAIGIYFGYVGRKSRSAQQYLSGVQDIKLSAIAFSLVASTISPNVFLAFSSEVYAFGITTILMVPVSGIVILLAAYVYIPIYYKTGVSNAFEYLEHRFDWKVSRMISTFYVLYTYTYTPITQYVACLAFSQVSGINVHMVNALAGLVCIIYTMIGGIKAVIWTDVVQATIMYIFSIAIIVYGVINVGGLDVVFKRSEEGGRLNLLDFDPDPTKRNSFWLMISSFLIVISGLVPFNQTCVQRLIALKSKVHARRAILIFLIGFVTMCTLIIFTGLVIFASYHKCDPVKSKVISKADTILPYFVMNTIGHWSGMPGLFISAMFSAALSTISAQLNSLSGIVYNDYFRKWRLFEHTDFRASLFMKLVVLITGIYFILAGFIIDNFGHIMQVTFTIIGGTLGVTTGVFSLGMLTPWANKHGAFYGAIIASVITVWMLVGNQVALKNGSLAYPPFPTSVEDCEFVKDNITAVVNAAINTILPTTTPEKPFILYRLSFYSFPMFSVVLVWVFGLIISFMTGYTKVNDLDKKYLVTCMHWLLPKGSSRNLSSSENEINGKEIINSSRQEEDIELQVPLNKIN